jgi:hypothetical protein
MEKENGGRKLQEMNFIRSSVISPLVQFPGIATFSTSYIYEATFLGARMQDRNI